jgi:hypothetical protein
MRTWTNGLALLAGSLFIAAAASAAPLPAEAPGPNEVRAIAKEAYVYGFPMVDSYRIQHAYFVDPRSPEYKGHWNAIKNIPRVYTPADKAVQTPNSDTPYSMAGLDLRAEPIVLTVPPVEKGRYFSFQLVDAYTFNFAYLGSRTTGNEGGSFLVAGPGWTGETPKGIRQVIRAETELVLVIGRTQLFRPDDLENVKKLQAGYRLQPLSTFLGAAAPKPAAPIEFVKPLSPAEQRSSPEFFGLLNFVLRFCPTHPSEVALMKRFERIGVGAGLPFDAAKLAPETRQALLAGMADAWADLGTFQKGSIETGKVTSGDLFGTRESLKNDYLYRFAAAVFGIFGNSKQEAMYPVFLVDGEGRKLDGASGRYTLRFEPGQLPPVHAFWSLTMYGLPESLLVENPIGRTLVNSPMLPGLVRDTDGGLTLLVQVESPGKEKEANWLPAPKGPFMAVLRLYWPKDEALAGTWKAPPMRRAQ